MEKNDMMIEANEALKRTLLMMNYDMKKTLTENVEVILEDDDYDSDLDTSYEGPSTTATTTVKPGSPPGLGWGHLRALLGNPKNSWIGAVSGQEALGVSLPNSQKFYVYTGPGYQGRWFEYTRGSNKVIQKGTWGEKDDKLIETPDGKKINTQTITQKQNKKVVPPVTDKNLLSKLNFEYQYPGDKTYVYDFVPSTAVTEQTDGIKGTWYAKNTKTGKVFQISGNYPSTEKNLDTQFPQAKNPVNKAPEPNATQDTQTTQDTQEPKNLNTTTDTTPTPVDDIQGKKLEVSKTGEPDLTPKNIQVNQKSKPTNTTTTSTDMEKNDIYGPSNPNIKESLKKNLSMIKENKENLLVETNIVQKRFSFIMEDNIVETEEDRDRLVESVISEIGYLKNQGYSSQAINEGLFSFLGSMVGGTAGATPNVFKEYLAAWLLKKLGVPEDSYIGSVVVTLVGDMGLDEYDKFFSDCRFASNKLADALIEGYLYQVQKEKGLSSNFSGFVVSAMRNAVSEYLLDDKDGLVQKLENQLSEYLCPLLSKLFGVISDKADDLKSKVAA